MQFEAYHLLIGMMGGHDHSLAADLRAARDDYERDHRAKRPPWLADHRLWTDVETSWANEERMLAELPAQFQSAACIPSRDALWCVTKWKYTGTWQQCARHNSRDDLRDATSTAFSMGVATDAKTVQAQVSALTGLQGVAQPMASVLLTFWQPEAYTVIDRRALTALAEYGRWDGALTAAHADYAAYLDECRALADEVGLSLRELDRALWVRGGDE